MKKLFLSLSVVLGFIFGIGLLNIAGRNAEAADVPEQYVVWDRMPAEAPVQMQLRSEAAVTLYVRPNSNVIAGELVQGEPVDRISVAVFTYPSVHPVKVLTQVKTYKNQFSRNMDGPTLYPGATVYLLMYTGEGTYLGWYDGQLVWWLSGAVAGINDQAKSPWAQYIGQTTDAKLGVDTWYCLRKEDGTVGWTQVQRDGQWQEPFKVPWQK